MGVFRFHGSFTNRSRPLYGRTPHTPYYGAVDFLNDHEKEREPMEREAYFEAVQDAIEALESMLKQCPERAYYYRPTIADLEWELDNEVGAIGLAFWLNSEVEDA